MNRSQIARAIVAFVTLSVVTGAGNLYAGQIGIIPLSDLVKGAHLVAVVEVTEVTRVDVSTGEGQLTSVYVARAVVEETIKSDRYPTPRDRKIAIVGSTIPFSSAVWRPIEKRRYLAFLRGVQGYYHYSLRYAFREVDENEKVPWYEYPKGGKPTRPFDLPLKEAVSRVRTVQQELAALAKRDNPTPTANNASMVLMRARGMIDLSAADHPIPVQQVILDAKGLADLLQVKDEQAAVEQAASALNVETIDFAREMVVAVSAGPVRGRDSLLHLTVTDFSAKNDELHVEWQAMRVKGRPGRPESADEPLVHPVRIVLADKFEGEVVFHPPTPK
jgi:hypothetical protein